MPTPPRPPALRALLFDVFGTCVDWRSGVAREGAAIGDRLGITGIDWFAVADAWRARYQPQLETVRSGARAWTTLDELHRESLDQLVGRFGLELDAAARDEFTLAWHRLDPWPDTVDGLRRLRRRFVIAPNSNANIALLVDLARRSGMPWDVILGAELARAYKPDPRVYLCCVDALGLVPDQVMMVAAHNSDLAAAADCGLRTAFVARPREYGPAQRTDLEPIPGVDVAVASIAELAKAIGA
jgi:2-haloacid dehalogenase